MIPYLERPVYHLGPFTLGVFGPLLGAAIYVGFRITLARARRLGIRESDTRQAALWALALGFALAHVAKLALDYTPAFVANPLIVFTTGRGIRSIGAFVGGILGVLGFCAARRIDSAGTLRILDAMGFSLPFSWAIGRLGCALVHDHRGIFSTSWMAVRFPEGPRYDLGLIECVFLAVLGGVFLLMDRRPSPNGFFFGLFWVCYGPFRIWLDTLHLQPWRYYEGAAGFLLGLTVLIFSFRPLSPRVR